MKDFIRVLFTPSCWIQNYQYNDAWDKKLNALMKNNNFIRTSFETATIGDTRVWIENHPYASFSPDSCGIHIRPSRATILKAFDKLIVDTI